MPRRWRRPQLALIALVLAVGIGYAIQALRDDGSSAPRPGASTSASTSGSASASSGPSTGTSTAGTRTPTAATSSLAGAVALSSLPVQAAQTVRLIASDGPFPYSQDGAVFGNNERLLPAHPRGYYHEYTVATPGSGDRGARRIVTGDGGEFYYTGDHYESFRRVDVNR